MDNETGTQRAPCEDGAAVQAMIAQGSEHKTPDILEVGIEQTLPQSSWRESTPDFQHTSRTQNWGVLTMFLGSQAMDLRKMLCVRK